MVCTWRACPAAAGKDKQQRARAPPLAAEDTAIAPRLHRRAAAAAPSCLPPSRRCRLCFRASHAEPSPPQTPTVSAPGPAARRHHHSRTSPSRP
uniref:Uncharacterized protein n=1 Tax=Oryza meridionalis TaxID=40149 RepID=A0A0E0D4N0_9ORYZ